jgi:hypothetical protein
VRASLGPRARHRIAVEAGAHVRADHRLDRERVGLRVGVREHATFVTIAQERDDEARCSARPAFFTSVKPSALDTSVDDSTTA